MKSLAQLTINGTPILAPSGVPTNAGPFGQNIIQTGTSLLLLGVVLLALGYLIYSGFQWMMSEGDKQRLEKARNGVIYSVIGLALAFLSFMIVRLVGNFFTVPLLP